MKTLFATLLICFATTGSLRAQTFQRLVDMQLPDGGSPMSALIQGPDGNLYGTAPYYGPAPGGGAIFRVTPDGRFTSVHAFCRQSRCRDGETPEASLLLATNGAMYGTTGWGGAQGQGTAFKLTSDGAFRTLYSFCATGGTNCSDGYFPAAPLAQGFDDTFYGSTLYGGNPTCDLYNFGCGTIFRIHADRLTPIYRFCAQSNCDDGANPSGGLTLATDGSFYGTTSHPYLCGQGLMPCGTVFKLTPKNELTTIYSFCTPTNCEGGANPASGLVQASDGNFYGTTFGDGFGYFGTFFKITPEGLLTTLYSFCLQWTCLDGLNPSGVIQGSDGNFYGTTLGGGTYGAGTVFMITPSGALTTLYNFSCDGEQHCANGAAPWAGLLQHTDGKFYGVTSAGGSGSCTEANFLGCGTVFSLDVGLGPFVTFVHSAGRVGQSGGILGQGFTGTSAVSIGGLPAKFVVVSDTFIRATVPESATTELVTVTTPSGILTSNVPFHVIP